MSFIVWFLTSLILKLKTMERSLQQDISASALGCAYTTEAAWTLRCELKQLTTTLKS